ncbi:MAG: hypothetical protein H6733_16260 [Alphaproteobacteria bacterium]|nr:hypothetical protein [Alphaproteobacteria bacterium]
MSRCAVLALALAACASGPEGEGWHREAARTLTAAWWFDFDEVDWREGADVLCSEPVSAIAETPEALDAVLAQATYDGPTLGAWDPVEEVVAVTWLRYCGANPYDIRVHGVWRNDDGRLQIRWSTPGGGDDMPGQAMVAVAVPRPAPTEVISDRRFDE